MKKLLLLPLLLLAFIVKAQLPVLRAPDGVTVEDTRLYILKNFRLPVYTDTTEANVSKGLDSLGTLFAQRGTRWVFIRDKDANGTHKWDTLGGSSSGGGASGDTVYLYQIGTAAGQIETLYAVDGNLRKSRWVPGYGTLPFLAPDSAAYIDIDTTSIAYKSWVISQFGTSINNLQQVIDNGHQLTRNDTITGSDLYSLEFDSLSEFAIKDHSGNALLDIFPSAQTTIIQGFNAANAGISEFSVSGLDSTVSISSYNGIGIGNGTGPIPAFTIKQRADQLASYPLYWPQGQLSGTPDTLATLRDVRAGSGGGGGTTNGVGRDTVQTYTSGTTLTQSASTNYIQVNPASVQATLTITTLASGGTWHTSNDLYIVFGGTVTSGNPVITTFALTAGSGLTIVESAAFAGSANAGDVAHYHKIGTILYRVP